MKYSKGGRTTACMHDRRHCWAASVPWLEYDHGGFRWPQRGVSVKVLVDLGPAEPQALALISLRTPGTDLPCSVASLSGGVGMSLQVQPPCGFGRTPPVHCHRDQVAPVLHVAYDDLPIRPGASALRGEPQRPPAARLWPPQTQSATRRPHQRAMPVPEQHHEPPRRQPGPPATRRGCPTSRIPDITRTWPLARDSETRAKGHHLSGPSTRTPDPRSWPTIHPSTVLREHRAQQNRIRKQTGDAW